MKVLALSKDRVAPGGAVTVPPCLKVEPLSRVNVPETVSAKVAASSVLALFTVTFVADFAASIVTVNPPSMIALSVDPGAVAPEAPPDEADHVDVEIQVPVATEYLSAPHAVALTITINTK